MDNKKYLDFDEAVQFLKTTPSTLYKWLQTGKIPGHKLGRQWRFLKDELEIHISGKASQIHTQKDFLKLSQLILERSKNKEHEMELSAHSITEKLIWDAFDHGSRLIHIYPSKGNYEISYRTQVGLQVLTSIQEDTFKELNHSLNQISNLSDESHSRRMYLHRSEDDVLQVRYQKLETVTGPRVTLRIYQPEKDVLPLEKITGNKEALAQFKKWTVKKSGLIFVTGANGSGKTTTIYSLLQELKNQGRVVFTIEDSAELVIEGINQVEVKGSLNENFENYFAKVYSSDPDVICLGLGSYHGSEEKIFNAAYKAASTGHLVIIQMDRASCNEAVQNFNQFVKHSTDHLLVGVSCQKLIEENGSARALYEFQSID